MTMFVFRGFRNPLSAATVLALGIGVSSCTMNPLSPFDDDGVVRQTTRSVGLSPKAVQAPGFVEKSRPETLEYVPVGVTPPARMPLNNPKQVEAELAAKRATNEAAAAAPKPASPYSGKIEPGYKPPPQAPIPAGGPELKMPGKAASQPTASGATRTKENASERNLRKKRSAAQSGETN